MYIELPPGLSASCLCQWLPGQIHPDTCGALWSGVYISCQIHISSPPPLSKLLFFSSSISIFSSLFGFFIPFSFLFHSFFIPFSPFPIFSSSFSSALDHIFPQPSKTPWGKGRGGGDVGNQNYTLPVFSPHNSGYFPLASTYILSNLQEPSSGGWTVISRKSKESGSLYNCFEY